MIIPRRRIWLPPSRRHQRGSVSVTPFANAAQQSGAVGCTFGSPTISNLSNQGGFEADGSVGIRHNSNGAYETHEGDDPLVWDDNGDWIGDCANTEYEVMLEHVSGDTLDEGVVDTWLPAETTEIWSLQSADPVDRFATVRYKVRRQSDNFVGIDVQLTMNADFGGS